MNKFKKILIGIGILGVASAAPLIPAGNGVISYAVFKDHGTNQPIYQEIPDTQYSRMGQKDGIKNNPTATSSDGVIVPMLYSAQYPTNDQQAILDSYKVSATSTIDVPPLEQFTDTDDVSLYEYLAPQIIPEASAAIAFDAKSTSHVTATSATFAHTITGTNPYLSCGVAPGNNVNDITSVKYNAVSLTQLQLATPDAFTVSHQYAFGLANPTTGTNNVVVTRTSSGEMRIICLDHTGVVQTSVPDNSGKERSAAGNTTFSATTTAAANTTWAVTFFGWQRTPGASTGITQRQASDDSAYNSGDSNGTITSPYSMTYTCGSCASAGDDSSIWLILAAVPDVISPPQDLIILQDE